MTSIPVACTLSDTELAARQRALQNQLGSAVRERVELRDGWALRFPAGAEWIRRIAEMMIFERACCPFLTLELELEAEQGPVWLKLRGPEGAKAFLQQSFAWCENE